MTIGRCQILDNRATVTSAKMTTYSDISARSVSNFRRKNQQRDGKPETRNPTMRRASLRAMVQVSVRFFVPQNHRSLNNPTD